MADKSAEEVGEILLTAVISSCVYGSSAGVRVEIGVSEWFPVNVGLRQGSAMSPWMVWHEKCYRVLGKGLTLLRANGGRFEISQLLFSDAMFSLLWRLQAVSKHMFQFIPI